MRKRRIAPPLPIICLPWSLALGGIGINGEVEVCSLPRGPSCLPPVRFANPGGQSMTLAAEFPGGRMCHIIPQVITMTTFCWGLQNTSGQARILTLSISSEYFQHCLYIEVGNAQYPVRLSQMSILPRPCGSSTERGLLSLLWDCLGRGWAAWRRPLTAGSSPGQL